MSALGSSRYVRRCDTCHEVRGLSNFRKGTGTQYADTCRWCRDMAQEQAARAKRQVRRLATIDRRLRQLKAETQRLLHERRTLEAETVLAVPAAGPTPDPAQRSLPLPRKSA